MSSQRRKGGGTVTVIRSAAVRRVLGRLIPFVLIPAFVVAGAFVFREKSYAYISLAVAALTILLFYSSFERRQAGTRRLIILSVMTAIAVVGRFIFSPVPGFTPITAIAVIAAVYLGGESGFFVGSMAALISNLYSGQGVWTPFQMFAWGMAALIAGFVSAPLKKSRIALCVYGVFAGISYSMLMDVWSVLWYNNGFSLKLYIAALVTALPHTAAYAVSNVIFLLLLAKPFGSKFERIKIKYGV